VEGHRLIAGFRFATAANESGIGVSLTHNLKTSLPRPNGRSYLISGPSDLTAYPEIATCNSISPIFQATNKPFSVIRKVFRATPKPFYATSTVFRATPTVFQVKPTVFCVAKTTEEVTSLIDKATSLTDETVALIS